MDTIEAIDFDSWVAERSDEELDALISAAQAIKSKRKEERDKKAWEQIQTIAKSRGFSVTKKRPRGRPPKKSKDKE